jgi:hypothetical protein
LRFTNIGMVRYFLVFTLRWKGLKATPKDIVIRIYSHGLLLFWQSWVAIAWVQSLLRLKHLLVLLFHSLWYIRIITLKVGMLKAFTCGWSLMRIEFQHLWQQVYRLGRAIWNHVHKVHRWESWEIESDGTCQLVSLRP